MNDFYVTEGASAIDMVKNARNHNSQAIHGKINEAAFYTIFNSFIQEHKDKKANSLSISLPIAFTFIHEYIDDLGQIITDELFHSLSFHQDIFVFEEDGSMFFEVEHKEKTKTEITSNTVGLFVRNLHNEIVYSVGLSMEEGSLTFPDGYYEDFYKSVRMKFYQD